MKQLETTDVFKLARLLKAIGCKESVKEICKKSTTARDAFSYGFELLWDVFERATEEGAEGKIYDFLSEPFEMSADEIRHLPFKQLKTMLVQFAEENDLAAFFTSAAESMR